MCQMLCQALRRQSLRVRGLVGKRRWVERYREVWAYSTSNDIDIPLTQLRFQGRGCLRQELEGFRRGQIQYLKDEGSPGKISVKAGRVKQLEAFGERTSNSAWPEQRTLEGAGEGVTEQSGWASVRGWESHCCSLKEAEGRLWAVPTSHLGRSLGFFDFSPGCSDSPFSTQF